MELVNGLLEQATVGLLPMLLGLLCLAARTYIGTRSTEQALQAVTGALERAAAVASAELLAGAAKESAVGGMVGYVERALPGALHKLKPAEGALAAMAEAVLLQTLQRRADARGDAALPGLAAAGAPG
jgi:hypothetical protein